MVLAKPGGLLILAGTLLVTKELVLDKLLEKEVAGLEEVVDLKVAEVLKEFEVTMVVALVEATMVEAIMVVAFGPTTVLALD